MSYTKTVTGRNIAHAKRTPTERGFLGADIKLGTRPFTGFTDKQAAAISGASFRYLRAALKVAAHPELRARVENGELGLIAAVQALRSQKQPKQPQTQPKQPAPTLLEQFAEAGASVRRECMAAFVDEAFELIDATTAPGIGPSRPDVFHHHH